MAANRSRRNCRRIGIERGNARDIQADRIRLEWRRHSHHLRGSKQQTDRCLDEAGALAAGGCQSTTDRFRIIAVRHRPRLRLSMAVAGLAGGFVARGLRMAGLIFFMTFLFWEFFTPFNLFGEPIALIAFELLFCGGGSRSENPSHCAASSKVVGVATTLKKARDATPQPLPMDRPGLSRFRRLRPFTPTVFALTPIWRRHADRRFRPDDVLADELVAGRRCQSRSRVPAARSVADHLDRFDRSIGRQLQMLEVIMVTSITPESRPSPWAAP